MRTVLTIVAVALVAVMSVALVAPYLIDWSAQRGEIEARLSAITGADVSLTGPVELRVLPTPYLALGEGLVSAPGPDGAKLSFASARLELALVKLASGQIRFSDIRLEKPVLTLTRGPDGALKLPPVQMAGLHSTGFDRLSVRDGRVKIVGAGAGAEISGVEIDAAAPSLDGPAHLNGQFSGPDNAPVVFRLASEKPGPDRDAAPPLGGRRSELACRRIRRRAPRRPGRRDWRPSVRRRSHVHRNGAGRGRADPLAGRRADDRRSRTRRPFDRRNFVWDRRNEGSGRMGTPNSFSARPPRSASR